MSGEGTNWIQNEVDKRLKNFQKSRDIAAPSQELNAVEFITFSNSFKTEGTTKSGIKVKTIPRGSVERDGWGMRVGNTDTYIVERDKVKAKNIDSNPNKIYLTKLVGPEDTFSVRTLSSPERLEFDTTTGDILAGAKFYIFDVSKPSQLVHIPFPNLSEYIPLSITGHQLGGPSYGRAMFSPNGKHLAVYGAGVPPTWSPPDPNNLDIYWTIYNDWGISNGALTYSSVEHGNVGAAKLNEIIHLSPSTASIHLTMVFSSTGVGNFYFGNYPRDKGRIDMVGFINTSGGIGGA